MKGWARGFRPTWRVSIANVRDAWKSTFALCGPRLDERGDRLVTQFLAYSATHDLGGERFEPSAAGLAWLGEGSWFTIAGGLQGAFDELMIDAQRALQNGDRLAATALYAVLAPIVATAARVVLWYASDFDDLERVSSADAFWEILERSIREPQAEAYIDLRAGLVISTMGRK